MRPTLLCALLTCVAQSARAQTVAVTADGGIVDGFAISGADGANTGRVGWFAGAAIASAPLHIRGRWDFIAGARVAREPALGMAIVAGRVTPAYFDAVRAALSLTFVHSAGALDVAIVGRYAETRTDSAQPLELADNDNGNWTFLFDAATHLRWYGARDAALPQAERRVTPLVDAYAGVKHDRRFHRTGDLEPYDDPTGRLIGGASVALWRWRDREGVPRLAIAGSGEFDAALRTGVRLPAGGRLFLKADVEVR